MRIQAAQFSLLQSLRGQQQMHVQRAAEAPDGDEEFGEVWVLAQQFGELVDDDDQRSQRAGIVHIRIVEGAGFPGGGVVTDVVEVPSAPQQFLAAVHLPGNGVVHALDQSGFVLQVGNHRRGVRQ